MCSHGAASGPCKCGDQRLSGPQEDTVPKEGKVPSFLFFLTMVSLLLVFQRSCKNNGLMTFRITSTTLRARSSESVLDEKNNLLPTKHYCRLCTHRLICHVSLGFRRWCLSQPWSFQQTLFIKQEPPLHAFKMNSKHLWPGMWVSFHLLGGTSWTSQDGLGVFKFDKIHRDVYPCILMHILKQG